MSENDRLKAKLPGGDTGIIRCNTVCDICAPGPHCGVTCYVKAGQIVKVEGTEDHPVNHGLLCTRGLASRQYVYRADRIKTPLRRVGERGEGAFESVSWEEAFAEIARRLPDIRRQYGASAVAFYSGYSKWYRPFLQRVCYDFGSVNYGTESSTCFTSTLMSWRLAAGVDCVRADLARAGVFLAWCANPHVSGYLKVAGIEKARARGMAVIAVDPAETALSRDADLHLRPRPGTDGALALTLGRELIVNGWTDEGYIAENVSGFAEYRACAEPFTPERAESECGVPAADIRAAARLIHEKGPLTINQSSSSMVHHVNGLQNHRAIMALSALTGSYGRPGGLLPGYQTYASSSAGFPTGAAAFSRAPYPQGQPAPVGADRFPLWGDLVGEMQACDLAGQILTGKPYPVRALWAHGMNARMFPDDGQFFRALKALDFFVDTDLFLTDSARYADLVLPACTSFERGEFKVFGGGYAQYTAPVIPPMYESRSDVDILLALAKALELDDPLLRQGYDACLREILRDTPVDLDELMADRSLPHKVPLPAPELHFDTPSGKFELYSNRIAALGRADISPVPAYAPPERDPRFPLNLCAGPRLPYVLHSRLHDVPWLRSMRPEPLAELHPDDLTARGIAEGQPLLLETRTGEVRLKAHRNSALLPGTVYVYHGYREADVNSVVPGDRRDPVSGFPNYLSVPCQVRRAET